FPQNIISPAPVIEIPGDLHPTDPRSFAFMPPPLLFDLSKLDLNKLIIDQNGIHEIIPQRFEMAQLDGIIHIEEPTTITGVKYVRDNEWWCRGHIPGRPLMPGVLMIECA